MTPLSSIDLNLLRIFDAVMAERNVTRAALALHMTQPAVSNAITRLRARLDDPLFVKVQGGVMPTHRAQSIWPAIRASLQRIADVLDEQHFDPAQSTTAFRFAMSDYVADEVIRPLFLRLQQSGPAMSLHVRPHNIRDAIALLEKGEIDMAAGVFSNFPPNIRTLPLTRLNYVCAMRRDHPILQSAFTLEAFLTCRHLIVSLSGQMSLLDYELAELGIKRAAALTVNHFSLAPRLLMESDLICIVPESVVKGSVYRDSLIGLTPPCPVRQRTVHLVWHERSDGEAPHIWLREQIANVCAAEGLSAGGQSSPL